MSPCSARSFCSSNTWLTSPWSRMVMMWPPCGGGDAGRLLAAVLERVEREVGQPRDVAPRRHDAEDAALVARAVTVIGEGFGEQGGSAGATALWTTGLAQASNPTGGAGARPLAFRAPRRRGLANAAAANTDPRNGITMAIETPVQIPRQRIQELIEREEAPAQRRARARRAETYERARMPPGRRRRLVLPAARPVADLPRARRRARRSGTSTATRCTTSTTASARWSRATRTRRSGRRSSSRYASARTSPRRPRTRSSSPRSSPRRFGPAASGAT